MATREQAAGPMTKGREEEGSAGGEYVPLFETKQAKGRWCYRAVAATVFVNICLVWIYRITTALDEYRHIGLEKSTPTAAMVWWFSWVVMLGAELWFGFYWMLAQSLRWNRIYRYTFKDRLSKRYERELPKVDIFVCTADPIIEPPIIVINTVLSLMAYDYPLEKLSIYLSDDGGSELTFYALLEASRFSRFWLPFCSKYNVKPRCPVAYFKSAPKIVDINHAKDLNLIKEMYEEMAARIDSVTKLGQISESVRQQHNGFACWSSTSSKQDHATILQILVDGRNLDNQDEHGTPLPSLVYLAREKRPQHFHNFKAGAMNALIRVSSVISNAPIILNVDCDMYSNNVHSIRDAACFFMDEKQGQEIAYVQFPQKFENTTKNDLYGSELRAGYHVELPGQDNFGGPLYIGSGCFHRRDVLSGKKHDSQRHNGIDWSSITHQNDLAWEHITMNNVIEEKAIPLASSTYEYDSKWGSEMGLKYGCAVEDVLTGLTIQCRGWKSVYFNPKVPGFVGLAPTTLIETLVQQKRWSEGHLQITLSKSNPLWLGRQGRIALGLQLTYLHYGVWALNGLPMLAYSIMPPLCLMKGIQLFPKVSSPWFLPFAYVIIMAYTTDLVEFLWCEGTVRGWWNDQRIWIYKCNSSFLFASIDYMSKFLGFSNLKFVITSKVASEDVDERYNREKMEFGVPSQMFVILTTLALINPICLIGSSIRLRVKFNEHDILGEKFGSMVLQIFLCMRFVSINIPLYEALFLRHDEGKMPSSVILKASLLAIAIFVCFL